MPSEAPYLDPFRHPPRFRPYRPARQLGQTATACPTRPLWWLLVAAALGGAVGFKLTEKTKGRRRS